jgi:hypothetical protein
MPLIMIDYPSRLIPLTEAAANNSTISTTSFITYSNTQYRFAIQYPENWNIEESDSAILSASPVDGS